MSDGGAWTPEYVTVTPAQELPGAGWGLDLSSVPGWVTDLQKIAQVGVDTYSKIYQLQNSASSGESPAPAPGLPAPYVPEPVTVTPAQTLPPEGGFMQDVSDFYAAHQQAIIIGAIGLSAIVLISLMRQANKRGE